MSVSSVIQPGDIIAGKYRVDGVIGRGGMGIVVAATHVELDQRVAVKLMLGDSLVTEESLGRFSREARATARIQSDHIARVFDIGMLPTGAPYMVMELLEGRDVASLIKQHGVLPLAEAVRIVIEASVALAEAHTAGIIHRDLKPANLFVANRSDGTQIVKVLDFGVSKYNDSSRPTDPLTQTNALVGSLNYISPEQMASARDVDARSDIWALGVILHKMLTGKTPFDRESMPETFAAIMKNLPVSIHQQRADIPLEFDAIVLRCLQSSREHRYQNVGELVLALSRYATGEVAGYADKVLRVLARASPPVSGQLPTLPVSSVNPGSLSQYGMSEVVGGSLYRRRGILAGAAIGFVALGVIAAVVLPRTSGTAGVAPEGASSTSGTPNSSVAVLAAPPSASAADLASPIPTVSASAAATGLQRSTWQGGTHGRVWEAKTTQSASVKKVDKPRDSISMGIK